MADTSTTLLDSMQNGSEEAWATFASEYGPFIGGWLSRFGLDRQWADEVQQRVLVKVFEELPVFRHNRRKGAFRKWLREITHNQIRAFFREHVRQSAASGPLSELANQLEDPRSGVNHAWEQEHARIMIATLMKAIRPRFEEKTLEAFRRTFFGGQSLDEVGRELQMTPGNVRVAKSRVLHALKQAGQGLLD